MRAYARKFIHLSYFFTVLFGSQEEKKRETHSRTHTQLHLKSYSQKSMKLERHSRRQLFTEYIYFVSK